jgi:hypothetical protein
MSGSIDLHQLDPTMQPYLDTLHQRADRALGIFEEMEQKAGVLSYEKRLVDDDAINGMSLYARYCDLAIACLDVMSLNAAQFALCSVIFDKRENYRKREEIRSVSATTADGMKKEK